VPAYGQLADYCRRTPLTGEIEEVAVRTWGYDALRKRNGAVGTVAWTFDPFVSSAHAAAAGLFARDLGIDTFTEVSWRALMNGRGAGPASPRAAIPRTGLPPHEFRHLGEGGLFSSTSSPA
jgi:hypothetical protein